VSLSDMKAYLRVTGTVEDSVITDMIYSAARHVENYCRLLLLPGTVTEIFTKLPVSGSNPIYNPASLVTWWPNSYFSLGVGNLISLTSVSANTTDDIATFTAMSSTKHVDSGFNRPRLYAPEGWEFSGISPYQIKVVYTAGYADAASVPAPLRNALKRICADMFENRMNGVDELTTAAEILMQDYVVIQGV